MSACHEKGNSGIDVYTEKIMKTVLISMYINVYVFTQPLCHGQNVTQDQFD